jgi:hypothetical protein
MLRNVCVWSNHYQALQISTGGVIEIELEHEVDKRTRTPAAMLEKLTRARREVEQEILARARQEEEACLKGSQSCPASPRRLNTGAEPPPAGRGERRASTPPARRPLRRLSLPAGTVCKKARTWSEFTPTYVREFTPNKVRFPADSSGSDGDGDQDSDSAETLPSIADSLNASARRVSDMGAMLLTGLAGIVAPAQPDTGVAVHRRPSLNTRVRMSAADAHAAAVATARASLEDKV